MKRICVIDGNDRARESLAQSLIKHGYDVIGHASASAAMAACARRAYDLVIGDADAPSADGVELARRLREIGVDVPVILLTAGDPVAVESSARALGIARVLRRGDDPSELWSAVRYALHRRAAQSTVESLDELRMGLVTDLSHQLRTPLTALKLAMEGLFDQLREVMDPAQTQLARISRRNIDRVVSMVESQLELLQMTLGQIVVARRLVNVAALVEEITTRLFGKDPDLHGTTVVARQVGTPVLAFTDPDALATLVSSLLCGGAPNARREVSVVHDDARTACQIDVRMHYLADPALPPARVIEREMATGGTLRLVPAPTRLDFEHRACTSMVAELGGTLVLRKDADEKHVRITLPLLPAYDRGKDFLNPVRLLRRTAERKRQNVSFLKCEFDTAPSADADALAGPVHALSAWSQAVLTAGDTIVRGRVPGAFFLALVDRSPDELDRVRDSLSDCAQDARGGAQPRVPRPQTVVTSTGEIDRLVQAIELV
ncbi:MAG: response regulator [Candidatus Krumholzibacteria bacterium]|nr:response regulator [Candidatus Krumholzibacteria bacterium]